MADENRDLTLGSLFSGIGGFDLGFERVGFKTKWQVEIDKDCRRVLRRHWSKTAIYGDIEELRGYELDRVDVICAGVPCQDVSVAGQRAGLAGRRTGLFYEFARILRELRPAWFVFENVPGLFSSNGGRDFAEVLRVLMVECGYGVSWRVLDSRYFGVAQRRRRVFVVGRFGRPCPPEVLFESDGGKGNSAAGQEAWPDVARTLANSSVSSGYRYDPNGEEYVVTNAITAGTGRVGSRGADDGANIIPAIFATLQGGFQGGFRSEPEEHLVAATLPACRRLQTDGNRDNLQVAYALRQDPGGIGLGTAADSGRMREVTGLSRGMDSRRYRQLGNAVTVNVAYWIARRMWNCAHL